MTARQVSVEPDSETWRAIQQWIEARLQLRRATLECMGLPVDETENARGAIEELQELERLATPSLIEMVEAVDL